MATTAYSSVSLSYYPTKSFPKGFNIHTYPPPCLPSPSRNTIKLVSVAALATATAADEGVALTYSAAIQSASAAVSLPFEMEKFLAFRESDNEGMMDGRDGILVRRRRRRKRRKLESEHLETGERRAMKDLTSKPRKPGQYLTARAEAEYSFCLKEEARVEALRKKVENANGRLLTLSQWAKAAGMSRISLDRILCNGREAQERIIRCYRRLVVSVAASYQGKGLSKQDLIQEGILGLLHGAKKFNPQKGYKLSTYVYWWIKQAISRAVAKKSKITRIPGSISELVPRICEANAVLGRRLGRFPTCAEIAAEVNKNVLTVGVALERNREPISLDIEINGGSRMSLQEITPGPEETTPEVMVKKQFMKRDIEKLLRGLCDRELNILKLHFGLDGETPKSFEEIGRHFKLSRERVRQISWTALSKLRQNSVVNDLKVFIA